MKKMFLCAAAVLLATSSPAMAAFVVDTGAPPGTGVNLALNPDQDLAGFFTLGAATTITAVEGFINSFPGATGTVTIFSDGATPSAANILFTATFATIEAPNPGEWQGVFGKSWNLAAGNYWVGFGTSGPSGMFSGAPSPLSNFAFTSGGNWFSNPFSSDNIGVRISGVPTGGGAVPEPASWAMMIAGFGLVGGAMRRRNSLRMNKVSYA